MLDSESMKDAEEFSHQEKVLDRFVSIWASPLKLQEAGH
jgi:hypothetical protein